MEKSDDNPQPTTSEDSRNSDSEQRASRLSQKLEEEHPFLFKVSLKSVMDFLNDQATVRRICDNQLTTTYQKDFGHADEHPIGNYESLMIAGGFKLPKKLVVDDIPDEEPCSTPVKTPFIGGHQIPGRIRKDFSTIIEEKPKTINQKKIKSRKGSVKQDDKTLTVEKNGKTVRRSLVQGNQSDGFDVDGRNLSEYKDGISATADNILKYNIYSSKRTKQIPNDVECKSNQ